MSIIRWLLLNPLTDCLLYFHPKVKKVVDYVHLIIYSFLGHTFYNLGCFLLDLLPYRNKSDSLIFTYLYMLYITVPSFKYGEEITTFPHFYLSAVPVYNILKAILIYISQKTSYRQTRFVCHFYTPLFREYCYIHLFRPRLC